MALAWLRSYNPKQIKKILVVRPDALGDMALLTPALMALREQMPHAHITVLASSYNAPLIQPHPAVDEVMLNPIPRGNISWQAIKAHAKTLRAKQFDLVIHFYSEWPIVPITWLARIPYRIGDKSKFHLRWFYNFTQYIRDADQTKHVVEYWLQLVAAVSQPQGVGWWRREPHRYTHTELTPLHRPAHLVINPEANAKITTQLHHLVPNGNRLAGVHISVGGDHPTWPPEDYARVVDHLIEKHQYDVILTGTERDISLKEKLLAHTRTQPIDLVGKTSLAELLALLSHYQLYIGMDTGPAHMATAFQIPTVSIFQNKHVKPSRWGPWLTPHHVARTVSVDEADGLTVSTSVEDVLQGIDSLTRKPKHATYQESFYHWFPKSHSVTVLIDTPKDLPKAEVLLTTLKQAGIATTCLSPYPDINHYLRKQHHIPCGDLPWQRIAPWETVGALLRWFTRYDTTIVHHLGSSKRWLLSWTARWAAFQSASPPPAIIFKGAYRFTTPDELMDFYHYVFETK